MIGRLEPLDIIVYVVMKICLHRHTGYPWVGYLVLERMSLEGRGSRRQKSCCIYLYP